MKIEGTEIEINGIKYVPKGSESKQAYDDKQREYVVVRGDRSGVFAGYLDSKNGSEAVLVNVRRLWYWDGAASCSQLAEKGVSKPENCKFPMAVKKILVLDAIEILYATEEARKSLEGVWIWQA